MSDLSPDVTSLVGNLAYDTVVDVDAKIAALNISAYDTSADVDAKIAAVNATIAADVAGVVKALASGYQVRFGSVSGTTDGNANLAIAYASAFPTATDAVVAVIDAITNLESFVSPDAVSASGFTAHIVKARADAGSVGWLTGSGVVVRYIAIGH